MSRIDTLTPQEIIDILGFNLLRTEVRTIFNYDEQIIDEYNKDRNEFLSLFINANVPKEDIEIGIIDRLIKRYPDKVNKRALVLLTIYNFYAKLEEDNSIDENEKRKIRNSINARNKANRQGRI